MGDLVEFIWNDPRGGKQIVLFGVIIHFLLSFIFFKINVRDNLQLFLVSCHVQGSNFLNVCHISLTSESVFILGVS